MSEGNIFKSYKNSLENELKLFSKDIESTYTAIKQINSHLIKGTTSR